MNGRLKLPTIPLNELQLIGKSLKAVPMSRFTIALGCSCLLHAVLLFLPLFGATTTTKSPGLLSVQKEWPGISVAFSTPAAIDSQSVQLPLDIAPSPEPMVLETTTQTNATPEPAPNRIDQADLLPLPGIIYYPTSFLTTRPQPLFEADLDPPAIRRIVASGKMILTLWINPLGETAKVLLEATNLPPSFSNTATAAFMQLRFKPGELYGNKVGTVMRIEVTYDDGRLLKTEIVE